MRDLALYCAGSLAILASSLHGYLGEARVFRRATIEPRSTRLLLRLVWQCGTIAWISIGALLLAAPGLSDPTARTLIVVLAIVTFGAAALGNAWATRGRHFGWMAMAAVVATAVAGW